MRSRSMLALLFALQATAAEPSASVALFHRDGLDGSLELRQASYVVDGHLLYEADAGHGDGGAGPLFQGPLEPGLHSVAVRLVYEGRSDVFSYIQRYRLLMRGRMTVDVKPGYVLEVRTSAEPKPDPTLPWEQRVTFQLEGAPRRAVLDLEVDPVQKQLWPEDGGELPLEPAVTASPEKERELQAKAVAEVRKELEQVEKVEKAVGTPVPPPAEASARCPAPALYFGFGRFTLDAAARKGLAGLAACLARAPGARMRVEGHCDARGSASFNQQLGEWRAGAAVRFLEEHGVRPGQLEVVSFGKEHPVCEEDSAACHARNRRVTFSPAAPVPQAQAGE